MKARSAALQGGLAAIGLVAAYLTWQRPKDTGKAESVVILEATKTSLERVRFEDGTRFVALEKKDRFFVSQGFLPGKRPEPVDAGLSQVTIDGGVDGGTPLVANFKPPIVLPDRTAFANDRADTVWGRLTPFEGTRALGQLSAEKRSEVGLADSPRMLEIQVSGIVNRFIISKPMSGLIGNYAQNEKTGEVFLIGAGLFNDLDPNSQLLLDRRLHRFQKTDVDAFTVSLNGRQGAFVQQGGNAHEAPTVARASSPDKPDELAKNWHDKVWDRVIVTDVLGVGETPPHGEPQVQLRIEYSQKGQSKGWFEWGLDPSKGTWARSENTPGWVSIHDGSQEVFLEAEKILNSAP